MDGRLNLFSDVKRAIEAQVPDVQHVDLYNENVEYVDEESPWQRPAVYRDRRHRLEDDGGQRADAARRGRDAATHCDRLDGGRL